MVSQHGLTQEDKAFQQRRFRSYASPSPAGTGWGIYFVRMEKIRFRFGKVYWLVSLPVPDLLEWNHGFSFEIYKMIRGARQLSGEIFGTELFVRSLLLEVAGEPASTARGGAVEDKHRSGAVRRCVASAGADECFARTRTRR